MGREFIDRINKEREFIDRINYEVIKLYGDKLSKEKQAELAKEIIILFKESL